MLEWFNDATGVERVANAFLLVCTGLSIVFGVKSGKIAASVGQAKPVEVVGAVVDGSQVRNIVHALDNNTAAIKAATGVIRDGATDIRDASRDLRNVIRKINE